MTEAFSAQGQCAQISLTCPKICYYTLKSLTLFLSILFVYIGKYISLF